ncbi:hypothetical protein LMG27198_00580 [Methylocystis echinoides]|uniref:Pseudouridine synthase n=2 Tax=Methylocystis echinoides TaxID=29468 RepID=A0A9W6GQJ4_9HYPH|nr:hypothetical protein LMG27198_00580 [Methylocystis echinoides]
MRRRDPDSQSRPRAAFDKSAKGGKDAAPRGAAEKGAKGGMGAKGAPKGGRTVKPARKLPPPVERTSAFEGERIAKAMARAGVCSRRDAEDWIAAGRVAVNGRVLTNPAVNVTEADKVTIDGAPMQARERTRLFLFHKPGGYVTTAHDPEGRATVFAYLEERHADLPRLVSVGRLDINTEGLLLLTNDGGLARTLELPATGWTRRYRVRVHGDIDQARLDALRAGVTVDDVDYAPIEARLERVQGANAWIAMALTEGKNREIKRVMEHLGLAVTRLIRISYGPFQLGDLAEGAVEEVKLKVMRDQLGKALAELAGVDFASPLREATPTEAQEKREHAEKRPRKHVSVLRKQREEEMEKGPRARIERGATADRKGRAVAVERVTPTRRKPASDDAPDSRNARRFEAMRAGPRRPRPEAEAFERPARGRARPEGEGFDKRRAPRAEGAERPARPPRGGGDRRGFGERPQGERAYGDARPARAPRARPPEGEGRFERPARGRARPEGEGFDKRRAPRAEGAERPARAPRGGGDRRGFGERPQGERAYGDARPARAPRARPPEGEARFERPARSRARPEGEGFDKRRAPRAEGADRPPRAPRGAGAEGFERPPRNRAAAQPRDDRPPRDGVRKGPPRGAGAGMGDRGPRGRGGPGGEPGRGPGRGAGKGPGRGFGKGPGKGPGNGPGRGPAKGPRKPRG